MSASDIVTLDTPLSAIPMAIEFVDPPACKRATFAICAYKVQEREGKEPQLRLTCQLLKAEELYKEEDAVPMGSLFSINYKMTNKGMESFHSFAAAILGKETHQELCQESLRTVLEVLVQTFRTEYHVEAGIRYQETTFVGDDGEKRQWRFLRIMKPHAVEPVELPEGVDSIWQPSESEDA